jgi:hypothetical protein
MGAANSTFIFLQTELHRDILNRSGSELGFRRPESEARFSTVEKAAWAQQRVLFLAWCKSLQLDHDSDRVR